MALLPRAGPAGRRVVSKQPLSSAQTSGQSRFPLLFVHEFPRAPGSPRLPWMAAWSNQPPTTAIDLPAGSRRLAVPPAHPSHQPECPHPPKFTAFKGSRSRKMNVLHTTK